MCVCVSVQISYVCQYYASFSFQGASIYGAVVVVVVAIAITHTHTHMALYKVINKRLH